MRKIIKMVTCLWLVSCFMLLMTGCSKGKVEETVTAFLDTYLTGDIERAVQYVDGGEAKELPYVNFEERDSKEAKKLQQKFENDFHCSLADYEPQLLTLTREITKARTDRVSYIIENIEKVEGEKNTYRVSVKWSSIDVEQGESDTQKKVSQKFVASLDELEKTGRFKESDSIEEQVKVFFPEMIKAMKEAYMEASEKAEVVEKQLSLTVTKIDGKWVIRDGNADAFDENHVLRALLN